VGVLLVRALPFGVFFFQAEDGIRDRTVTGVQTCALPISHVPGHPLSFDDSRRVGSRSDRSGLAVPRVAVGLGAAAEVMAVHHARSEERRVGKEGRRRWARWQQKKNASGRAAWSWG